MTGVLVPADVSPGLVPVGFSEAILKRAADIDDPALLWDGVTTFAALAQKWNGHGRERNEIKAAQMFCEIELGQRLHVSDSSEDSRAKIETIPAPRVSEFRRYFGHRDFLVEQVREGKRSRRALLLAVDRLEARPTRARCRRVPSGSPRSGCRGRTPQVPLGRELRAAGMLPPGVAP